MFSFCLQADNLEFSHINQLLFSLVVVSVRDYCSDDSESLIVQGNDDGVGENGNSVGKPLQSTFHRFVSSSRRQLLRGFSSFTQSM